MPPAHTLFSLPSLLTYFPHCACPGSSCLDCRVWRTASILERQPQMASYFVTGSIGYACSCIFLWCGNKEDRIFTLSYRLEPEFRTIGYIIRNIPWHVDNNLSFIQSAELEACTQQNSPIATCLLPSLWCCYFHRASHHLCTIFIEQSHCAFSGIVSLL